jgi:hypothetical protein
LTILEGEKVFFWGKLKNYILIILSTGPDYKNHDKRNVPFAAAYTDSELI